MSPKQTTYARVEADDHGDDTHDDSSSSTDMEGGALMSRPHSPIRRERHWDDFSHAQQPGRQSRRRNACLSVHVLQGLANTVLTVFVLALLLDRRERYGRFEGNGDMTGFIPPVSQQITTFVPDVAFAPANTSEFFTPEVKHKWLNLVPKGLGYLQVEDPSLYNNLPHPLEGYPGTTFTTSVTHQLHCLYNILEVYSSLESGKHIAKQMQGHLPHCFEYLRQSIMCCGDTAIEGQHTTFPDGILGSDGWDAKHVCKDFGQVYAFLEEHRTNNDIWI